MGACFLFQAYFVSISSLCKNETIFKNSLSLFQACVKMKPNSSRVSWFQACVKMKPFPFYLLWFPFYQLVSPDEPWFSHSIITIYLANHMPSLGCFTRSWGTAAMSGLVSQPLDLYLFWVVPSSSKPVATLNTTHSSRRSHLSALFWLSKIENISQTIVVLNSLKVAKRYLPSIHLTPFLG